MGSYTKVVIEVFHDVSEKSDLSLAGRPNLRLFNQLFWLILIPYCTIGIFMSPLMSIITGSFSLSFRSKLCLQQSVSEIHVIKQNIAPLIAPLIATIFCTYWEFKSKRYLKGMCPNGNMSGIGNYRRNFATFEDTVRWIQIHFIQLVLQQAFLFTLLQVLECKPETNSLLSNISYVWFTVIYHGICVPAKMKVPNYQERKSVSSFFVRPMQSFEPRCPVLDQNHVVTVSKQVNTSQVSSKMRKKKRKAKRKTRVKAGKISRKGDKRIKPPLLIFVKPCNGCETQTSVDYAQPKYHQKTPKKFLSGGPGNWVKATRTWIAARPSSSLTIPCASTSSLLTSPCANPCPPSGLTSPLDNQHGEEKRPRGMYDGSFDDWKEKVNKIEAGQKLKFNTDPKVDNSNMCDTGNGEKRKKRKPLSRRSTIIVDLSMKKPSRTKTFPNVEI